MDGPRLRTQIMFLKSFSDFCRSTFGQKSEKGYVSSLCVKIPNQPGKLGEVSSLIGFHENNIFFLSNYSKK